MKKLTAFLAMMLCLIGTSLHAQVIPKQVKGKVVDDATGTFLPGASVLLLGSKAGQQVGNDGTFTITIPNDNKPHSLLVSFVGYTPQTITVANATNLIVKLKRTEVDNAADEVVVIGYGTARRRDLTGSVSSVRARDLKDNPTTSAAQALAGRLAGVQIVTSEGAPGADVDIYIRGRNSITQSGSPLYIVDGVQLDNALSVLSPQDIQSIDVLKDAASTAIYGARGSNGVMIITTKGGKNTAGKTSVTYSAFTGTSTLAKQLDLMDPYNFVLWNYERAKYTENPTDTSVAAQYIRKMSNFDTIATAYKNYAAPQDWQKRILGRNAVQTTHNLSISGGTAITQYNLSVTINKQEGLISNSALDRKVASFRFDHKVSDKLKIGTSIRYNNQEITGAGTSDVGGAGSNNLRQYTRYRPLLLSGQAEDFYDANLDITLNPGNGLNLVNPIQLLNAQYRLRTTTAYNFTGYATYSLNKKISFKSSFGYDVNQVESKGYDDTLTSNARVNGRLPVLNLNNGYIYTINNSNVFTYNNPSLFKTKHGLDVLVGQEIYQVHSKLTNLQVNYFPAGISPDQAFANLGLAAPPAGLAQPKPSSTDVTTRQLSFFTRFSYNYNKRYFVTFNFRADGSSLFGADYSSPIPPTDPINRKWGFFPSASAAWRISDEKFMQNVKFVSDAKIRLSYGSSGNNRIQPYGYTTGYAPPSNGGYGLSDVLNYTLTLPSRLGNPAIKWETLTSKNLGLDLALFNNKLNVTLDVYSNTTKDLLIENKIPPTSGYTTQYQNVGTTKNDGVELQLSSTIIRKKNFSWTSSFNIAFNKNKIISLGNQSKFTANSGWFSTTANPDDYLLQVGQEVGTMYGLVVDGFYKPSDFIVSNYTNVNYPNLLFQYTLDPKLADPIKVLGTIASPGLIKYKDVNGDNKITLDSDRTVIGHALPKFTGGFNQQFAYKGFDASVFINFSYGNDVFNANKLEYANAYGLDQNMLAINNNRWRVIDASGNLVQKQINATTAVGIAPDQLAALNAGASIWQPFITTSGFAPSSFAVEDGSYIRINNITVGYTLPQKLTQKVKIGSLRFYATANNVATITGYSGYDPEVNARRNTALTPGVDYSAYPRGRTFVAGLNVTF